MRPGRFLSAGYLRLRLSTSLTITRDDAEAGRVTSVHWLRRNGVPLSRPLLRLAVDHPRGYRRPEIERVNRAIRDETANLRRVRAALRLDRHLSAGPAAPGAPRRPERAD